MEQVEKKTIVLFPFIPRLRVAPHIARIIRDIGIFSVMILLTMALFWPVQVIIREQMQEFRDFIFEHAVTFMGRSFTYDSLKISLLGRLKVHNLRVEGSGTEPILSIDRVNLSFSLANLAFGKLNRIIQKIELDSPRISVDADQDRAFFEHFAGSPTPPAESNESTGIMGDIKVNIRHGNLRFRNPSSTLFVEDISCDAVYENQRFNFRSSLAANYTPAENAGMTILGRLTVAGNASAGFQNVNSTLNIEFLAGLSDSQLLFELKPAAFVLSLTDNQLEVKNRPDTRPVQLSGSVDLDSGLFSAVFNSQNARMHDFISIAVPLDSYLEGRVSGTASVSNDRGLTYTADLNDRGLTYTADLHGVIPVEKRPLSFEIRGNGTQHAVTVDRFFAEMSGINAQFRGTIRTDPVFAEGLLAIRHEVPDERNRIAADIRISTTDTGEIALTGDRIRLGSVPVSRVYGLFTFSETGVGFSASALRPRSDSQPSQIAVNAFVDYAPWRLEAWTRIDSLFARDIRRIAGTTIPIPEWADDVAVTTEIFASTDFKHITYHAPVFEVVYSGTPDIFISTTMSGSDRHFTLHEGTITTAGIDFLLSGSVDWADPHEFFFMAHAENEDIAYDFSGTFLDQHLLSVNGYGLNIQLGFSPEGGFSGFMLANNIPVPYKGQYVTLTTEAMIRYQNPRSWGIDFENFECENLPTPVSLHTTVGLSGSVGDRGLTLSQLFVDDGRGPLNGMVALEWKPDFSVISGTLSMSDNTGTERYALDGSWARDEHTEIYLTGNAMQLGRWVPGAGAMEISGNLNAVLDSPDSYTINVRLDSLSGAVGGSRINAHAGVLITPDLVSIADASVNYMGFDVQIPDLTANRPDARVEGTADVRGSFINGAMSMQTSVKINFNPVETWLHVGEALKNCSGIISMNNAAFHTVRASQPFQFVFVNDDSGFSLSGGPRNFLRLKINKNGDLYAGVAAPFPIRGSITGRIHGNYMDVLASNVYTDLDGLYQLIPAENQKVFRMPGGFVTGNLRIVGDMRDPEFFGRAVAHSVRIQVPQYVTTDMRPVPFVLTAEGNTLSFEEVPFSAESGMGMISGSFFFEQWNPRTFFLDISVSDPSPVPFSLKLQELNVLGHISGSARLSMSQGIFGITGDINASDAEITMNFKSGAVVNDAEMMGLVTDIRLRTGPKVVFLWPSAEFPILQATAVQGALLAIKNDTLNGHFSITGDVGIQGGQIFYFERSFYVQQGSLSFNENEVIMDPKITVRAEARDRLGQEPVTIRLLVDNAPLSSFTARFESTPILSQAEILSLLGQSFAGRAGDSSAQSTLIASTADILAQTQVIRYLERGVRDFFHLDMFSIRTQILQNLMLVQTNRLEDDFDAEPVDRTQIGNYFDNTTVFIGKSLGRDMFVQALGQIRYDRTQRSFGGIVFEPEFTVDIHGPDMPFGFSFDIRSNISITPKHLNHLFVDDFSLSFIWRKSF